MRFLILDDDPTKQRIPQFKRELIGHVVVCVETAKETIEKLQQETFDVVCLDHDLGGKVYVESGPGTGYEVAVWLEEHPNRKPECIVIHSFNPTGAMNMKRALPEAIIAPGIWKNARKTFFKEVVEDARDI